MKQDIDKKTWSDWAIQRIEADFQRSSDTHLIPLDLAGFPNIYLYLKDESSHPTGSLKHRLARSLYLYALCNGWLSPGVTIIEASSGSTAISEAYFARLLGLPFIAVMPKTVSKEKIAAIEFQGGACHLVDHPTAIYSESARLAQDLGGHFMDQFTYAERATDWRGNNNIAESIFEQMAKESIPTPTWLVASAGTGGTLATLSRYVRYKRLLTKVCGVDAQHSVFFDFYQTRNRSLTTDIGSKIEGIGRPRVEASFLPDNIDAMVQVPDVWSIAAMSALSERLGRLVGASTGTNLIASLFCAHHVCQSGNPDSKTAHSIVTLLCDGGERYRQTYHNPDWLRAKHLYKEGAKNAILAWMDTGVAPAELLAHIRSSKL